MSYRRLGSRLQSCHDLPPKPDVTGSVLSVSESADTAPGEIAAQATSEEGVKVVYMVRPADRPERAGRPLTRSNGPTATPRLYITINDVVIGATVVRFEVFINSKKHGAFAWDRSR